MCRCPPDLFRFSRTRVHCRKGIEGLGILLIRGPLSSDVLLAGLEGMTGAQDPVCCSFMPRGHQEPQVRGRRSVPIEAL
jgi:hypothetical protein